VRKKATQLEKICRKLEKELGRPAEDEELAAAMDMDMASLYKLLDQTRNVQFLDIDVIRRRMPEGNEDDLFDLIADDGEHDPFELLNLSEIKELLVKSITKLPEKEKLVISLYYYEQLTMREIGEIMGYTESRISQMHTTAMMRLRGDINSPAGGTGWRDGDVGLLPASGHATFKLIVGGPDFFIFLFDKNFSHADYKEKSLRKRVVDGG
jgi:RNA polymerase sigma factor for flagellar operon FliA